MPRLRDCLEAETSVDVDVERGAPGFEKMRLRLFSPGQNLIGTSSVRTGVHDSTAYDLRMAEKKHSLGASALSRPAGRPVPNILASRYPATAWLAPWPALREHGSRKLRRGVLPQLVCHPAAT